MLYLGDFPYVPPEYHSTMNHPNRNPNSAAASPTPAQVRAARLAANLTPEQAGALIHERGIRWERFESGDARMHPAAWELFNSKTEGAA